VTRGLPDMMGRKWVCALALGALAFALYLRTAARSAVFGDGPELATAAFQLGVAHPTGYPLYTLLAHAFIRLVPFGEVIFRTTLLSVVASAATVAMVYVLGCALFRQRWPAAVVAVLFAVSDTFWSQAVVTEVYALHMLLIVGVLTGLVQWDRTGRRRYLRAGALLYGLSLTHHLMAVTWLPALLVLVFRSRHRRAAASDWRGLTLLTVAPLMLYAYLPLAAWRDPPMNWGDVRTVRHFVEHLSGAQYRFHMGHRSLASWWRSVVNYGGIPEDHVCDGFLLSQFGLPIVWLAPLGIATLVRRNRRMLWVTATAYIVPLLWALNYNITDPDAYFEPSHLVVALWIGYGLRQVVHWLATALRRRRLRRPERRRVLALARCGVLVLPAMVMVANWRLNDRSKASEIRSLGRAALEKVKPNSIVIASGDDWGFGMLYAYYVEGLRPDVVLVFEPFFQSRNFRLVTRERRRGLVVREPACSHASVEKEAHGLCRLERFILDNYRRAPLYIAGPFVIRLDESRLTKRKLPSYERVVERVPMLRFRPESRPAISSPELGD